MKNLLKQILAFLLLPSLAAATTSVTGKMQTLGTGNVTTGAFVRFWLRGCGGNQPRINGTSIIAPSQGGVYFFDIAGDASGNISGTLYSTRDATGLLGGDIECGGSTTAVWYGMQAFYAGKGGPEVAIHAKSGGTIDISNVTPITTNPVVTAPSGDSTYARLDGGNQPFTGSVTPSGNGTLNLGSNSFRWNGLFNTINANGAATFGSTLSVTGLFQNSALSASLPVCSDASKNLTSTCSGLIPNSSLANSSVTFNGQNVALGASGNVNAGAAAHSIALNEGAGNPFTGLTLGAHQVAVGQSAADPVAKTIPDCQDSAGNHVNYTQSTDSFSCGTSVPASAQGDYVQSTQLTGCGATCTYTYPHSYSVFHACTCSGVGGSCNISSQSASACTINTTVSTNSVTVTGVY